jgi:hypothetical protein
MTATDTVQVTPLLHLGEGGSTDVVHVAAMLSAGQSVTAGDEKTVFDVLVAEGCDPDWVTARINLALTGEWPWPDA